MERGGLISTWWFRHGVMLLLAAVVIGAAAQVTFFGWDVPVMCTWRRILGIECPGCGLTRSFVFLAHGELVEGFRMNALGPPMFLLVASQLVYRPVAMWREWLASRETRTDAKSRAVVPDAGA